MNDENLDGRLRTYLSGGGEPPAWLEDRLVAGHARRRAATPRPWWRRLGRPQTVPFAAAAGLALVAAVAIAADVAHLLPGGLPQRRGQAAVAVSPSSRSGPLEIDVVPPAPLPASPSPSPAPTPVAKPRPPSPGATPSRRPTPGLSPSPPPSSSPSPPPDCTTLAVTVTTDSTSYARGATVTFTEKVTNTGALPCQTRGSGCANPVYVDDASGNEVWSSTPPGAMTCVVPTTYTLLSGQAITFTYTWDQRANYGSTQGQVPAASYRAYGQWNGRTSAPAGFTIS